MNPKQFDPPEKAHRVPFTRFFVATGAQLLLALGLYALIAPTMFQNEVGQPWSLIIWTFLFGIPLSLFEYLYHRYLLHSAVLPFLGSMHRAHGQHHSLTSVKAPVLPHEPVRLVMVESDFPVEHEHQEESMMFPLYSISIFLGVFLILLALPLKFMFPGSPVLIALILAVTLSYSIYEVSHALLHLPYERFWKPRIEGRITGKLFRRIYGFHLMHHWRPTSNLAIAGFWGVALWDHLFRTHRRPERLPLHNAEVNFSDAKLKKPLWPISLMDRRQAGLFKMSRKFERVCARIFMPRSVAKPK